MLTVDQLQAQRTTILNRIYQIDDTTFGQTNESIALQERLWAIEDELEAQALKPAHLSNFNEVLF